MAAKKLIVLENSLGQKVRTFSVQTESLNLVYLIQTRRIEAIYDLKDLDTQKVNYQLIKSVKINELSGSGLSLKNLGRLRLADTNSTNYSPTYELPEENDKEELTGFLRKSTIGHIVAVILMISTSLIVTKFFSEKPEAQLVTIVVPKPETVAQKTEPVPHVKMSEKKIKQTNKVYKKVVKNTLKSKPYKTRTQKALDIQRVGALAALGGLKNGAKNAEGLDLNSVKNIRSAGKGSGGGGIGNSGKGGIKGYLPGTGLVAGSVGSGGRAVSAGGYGTKGAGGGKAGYGKIAMVGGTSAVSLPLDSEATVEGGLDRDQIIAVINKNRGQIVYCYERGLQTQPQIGGRVAIDFVIGPNGRVSKANVAQSTLASRSVEGCIVARMKTWQFPKPVGKVNVDVLYPFELMRVSSR